MRPSHETVIRILLLLTLAACAWQGFHWIIERYALTGRQEVLVRTIADIEARLAGMRTIDEAKQAKTRKLKIALADETARQPANHSRLLRLLKMLDADKQRTGPAEPLKLAPRYSHAGLGVQVELLGNSEYAAAYRIIERYRVETYYAKFTRQMSARNVDTSRLIDLILEESLAPMDADDAGRRAGLPPMQRGTIIENARQQAETEISQFLGAENYLAYQTYQRIGHGNGPVDNLQQRLSYVATPLNDHQYEALTVLGNSGPAQLLLEGTFDEQTQIAARPFLTPEQFAAMTELFQPKNPER